LTIDSWINGKIHVVTLDTGASHSIIRRELVKKTAIQPLSKVKLKTATGEQAEILGSIQRKVTIGGKSTNHEFLVAAINDDVILGLDFMEKHNFTLDLKNRILKYYNLEIPLETGYQRRFLKNEVAIVKKHNIPKYSKIDGTKVERKYKTCDVDVVDNNSSMNVGVRKQKKTIRKGEQHAEFLSRTSCNLNWKHRPHFGNKEGVVDIKRTKIVSKWTSNQIKSQQEKDLDVAKITCAGCNRRNYLWARRGLQNDTMEAGYGPKFDSFGCEEESSKAGKTRARIRALHLERPNKFKGSAGIYSGTNKSKWRVM